MFRVIPQHRHISHVMRLETMSISKPRLIVSAVGLLAFPQIAYANAVIPYLWVPIAQVFLFPVVVLAEAWLLSRWLETPSGQMKGKCFVTNLASTAVGAALFFTSMPLIGEPLWEFWRKHESLAAAALSLAVAAVLFLISWIIEAAILALWSRDEEANAIWRFVRDANAITYAALLTLSFLL